MDVSIERHGDVHRIRMSSLAGRAVGYGVSVYVVRGVMIDTGFHGARRAIVHAVSTLGVAGAIVTHWHEDHAGNVAALAALGVPMSLREETDVTLRRMPRLPLYRRAIWGQPAALAADVAAFAPAGFERLHTPGHTSDHQIVLDRETGTLFSGDLWLGVRSRLLHAAEDPYRIVESLRAAAALGPARMFDAHRGLVMEPVRAITLKLEWMLETLAAIERRIAAGATDSQVVKEVLGGEDRAALVSRGEYAHVNFVRAVRRRSGQG